MEDYQSKEEFSKIILLLEKGMKNSAKKCNGCDRILFSFLRIMMKMVDQKRAIDSSQNQTLKDHI